MASQDFHTEAGGADVRITGLKERIKLWKQVKCLSIYLGKKSSNCELVSSIEPKSLCNKNWKMFIKYPRKGENYEKIYRLEKPQEE